MQGKSFVLGIGLMVVIVIGSLVVLFRPVNPKDEQNLSSTPALKSQENSKTPPPMTIDTKKKYQAEIQTDTGNIVVELFSDKTPKTVNNFVTLAKQNFYNNTTFHRVVKDFMIQGGDPIGDGTGGPGYTFDDESFDGSYARGTLAMANAGPNTNGSQFFIMQKEQQLPKDYVIFGKVIQGLDVVDKIANAEVKKNSAGELSVPVTPVKVNTIKIVER